MDLERVQTLEKLMAMDPADAFSPYALGLEYLASQPERALEYYRLAVTRDPDFVGAYFQIARLAAEQGHTELARQRFEEAKVVAERTRDWHAHGEIEDALNELE